MEEERPVVLVRAEDEVVEGEGLRAQMSYKVLMLKSYGLKAKLVRFTEWRKEFEKSAEAGDAYIRSALARQ